MRFLLIFILLFQGLTAFFSGLELVRTNGMGMSPELLANSPFTSFFVPGLILTFVIGGTSLGAAYLLLRKHQFQFEASAIAGFGILIWIFVQIYIVQQAFFLQAIYFSSGIVILLLTGALIKKSGRHI